MKKTYFIIYLSIICLSTACSKKKADLIVYNGMVYSVDSSFSIVEGFAVKDGKIIAVGSNNDILDQYEAKEKIDAGGKAVFPGFIDAHCHFYNYGHSLQHVDLVGTKSFEEVVQRAITYSKDNNVEWITGRGWDQNDWEVTEFPNNERLNEAFPNTPVLLNRIDGHAAIANDAALRKAGITPETKVNGGIVEVKNGKPTGLLVDNAVELVSVIIPAPNKDRQISALLGAQKKCFAVGLTTIDDAGLDKEIINLIKELHQENKLKMRIYAMITADESNLKHFLTQGPIKTERLNVCSFKFYGDGALGSRGACLLEAYTDKPEQKGFLLNSIEHFKKSAEKLYDKKFQMNTHCIGDSANRLILDIYGNLLKGKNDRRWRIEHAQVVNPADFSKFGLYSIIPSVQATHATSDMYWVKDRLGEERTKGAYAYKALLTQTGILAGGSDFPVEGINPLLGFYAAVARRDLKGFPEKGFEMGNALTREEALKSMTIWAAFANFEEKEKGSIEPGKFADFVILNKNIMNIDHKEIPAVRVIKTYVNGELVYEE